MASVVSSWCSVGEVRSAGPRCRWISCISSLYSLYIENRESVNTHQVAIRPCAHFRTQAIFAVYHILNSVSFLLDASTFTTFGDGVCVMYICIYSSLVSVCVCVTDLLQGVEPDTLLKVILLFQVKGTEQGHVRPTRLQCVGHPQRIVGHV